MLELQKRALRRIHSRTVELELLRPTHPRRVHVDWILDPVSSPVDRGPVRLLFSEPATTANDDCVVRRHRRLLPVEGSMGAVSANARVAGYNRAPRQMATTGTARVARVRSPRTHIALPRLPCTPCRACDGRCSSAPNVHTEPRPHEPSSRYVTISSLLSRSNFGGPRARGTGPVGVAGGWF
jgi:hypothetical protein